MNYLSTNLKVLRSKKNLSQEAFSKSLNVARATYSGYENKVSIPPLEIIIKIADFYKISIDTLVRTDLQSKNGFELHKLLS